MDIRPLSLDGALEITPRQHRDERGGFLEWFRADRFREATGHDFRLAQANCSISAVGVVRGIHFSVVPPGQAKWVTCVAGAVFDVAVDLRVGSPTLGRWDAVLLDDVDRRAIYLPDGFGHAFMALSDGATLVYACSTPYAPENEHEVDALDAAIGIDWPAADRDGNALSVLRSDKDARAPSLADLRVADLLPRVAAIAR